MRRIRVAVALLGLVVLAACESGIRPDRESPRATARALGERVADLERQLGAREGQLTALAGPPATPTPTPSFAQRWRVEVVGPTELRPQVGAGDGLTPLAAGGVYVVVPIRVTNLTDAPAAFNPFRELVVVDGQDRTFEPDAAASGAAYLLDFGFEPSFGVRQPDVPFADVLVFDVATDASGFRLESTDGSFSVRLDR